MDLEVLVIGFGSIHETLIRDLTEVNLQASAVTHVPAVDARNDPRWLTCAEKGRIGLGASGCLLAHRDAWATWLNLPHRGDVGLVLEDDARITEFGKKWMNQCTRDFSEKNMELLQLGTVSQSDVRHAFTTKSISNVLTAINGSVEESRLMAKMGPSYSSSCGWGTHAYLISASCAEMFLEWDFGFLMPIDCWFRALSSVPHRNFARTRQALWSPNGRASTIDHIGR